MGETDSGTQEQHSELKHVCQWMCQRCECQRREGIWGKGDRRHRSTHSSPWDLMDVSGQHYILATLATGKQTQYPHQCWCT